MAEIKDTAVKVFFVGTGPGDPELITVKGMNLLKTADLVIYAGSLVREKVLGYCEKGPEIRNSASMSLDEITSLMVEAARQGKKVVRLHTGDPSLYGALREQADVLEKEGVAYQIVPGVSSAFASAAALKRELTLPGVTQTVIFTRVEGRTPVPAEERLSKLAAHGATICIFLSIAMIDEVVKELAEGYPLDTPVAVVYRASWEDETVVKGTLADIARKVKEAGIKRQAMIIVGNAIGDSPGENSKLYDAGFSHGYRE
ncbi:MAG: precorrin-4 C(11)-methyltransferase [Deltaproteobacteria bacterium GWA2_54_12]|nr:MAG: precorrin-4 C(11)-methyltransferase [Deltaproteobacteria bacterium GWA2_54_12]